MKISFFVSIQPDWWAVFLLHLHVTTYVYLHYSYTWHDSWGVICWVVLLYNSGVWDINNFAVLLSLINHFFLLLSTVQKLCFWYHQSLSKSTEADNIILKFKHSINVNFDYIIEFFIRLKSKQILKHILYSIPHS